MLMRHFVTNQSHVRRTEVALFTLSATERTGEEERRRQKICLFELRTHSAKTNEQQMQIFALRLKTYVHLDESV